MADAPRRIAGIALAALLAACSAPGPAPDELRLAGEALGTAYRVAIPRPLPAPAAALAAAVDRELELVDKLMSTYREDSELVRLNRHAADSPFPVSAETLEVLEAASAVSEATGGAFDITVGPLVDAWGFGPQRAGGQPAPEALAALLRSVGWRKLRLDRSRRTVSKSAPTLHCDLSGIAKGYAVDRAAEALAALGCRAYLVEVGGELRAAGANAAGRPWRVGIERPDSAGRMVHRILRITDTAVATSGDYRNFQVINGRRYSHILDPRTGQPAARGAASATVLHPSAMRADALATALLVLGEAEGLALAERADLAVLLLLRDSDGSLREASSPQFRATIKEGPR